MIQIDDPIFKFTWFIQTGGDLDYYIKKFCEMTGISETWEVGFSPGRLGHFATYSTLKSGLIWFKDKSPAPEVVAHESVHVAVYVYEKLSLEGVTEKTEEVFAYYVQWLTYNILRNTHGKSKRRIRTVA